jgi:hypothetical protein
MESLSIFTVYENPRDYPGSFVVRRFEVSADSSVQHAALPLVVTDTLDEARAAIRRAHPVAVCMARNDGDEPQIVESWI